MPKVKVFSIFFYSEEPRRFCSDSPLVDLKVPPSSREWRCNIFMKGQLCCNESRKSHRKIWPFSPFIDFVQTSHWFPHKLEPATETPALFICPLVENPGHRWKTWILSSPS